MLILTRKVDQGIVISGNIHIRVLGVQQDRVKIGISAPREITVLRDELVDKDEKEERNDSEGSGDGDSGNNNEGSSSTPAAQSQDQE